MITPTNGRVVLFTPPTEGPGMAYNGQPLAATVTHVWNDHMVNLSVFDANGEQYSRTSVPLIQDEEPKPTQGYYCEWMPYQKQVASGQIKPSLHATPGTSP